MGIGAFFGGMAKGASEELDTQEANAFKLKLQNAQIEGQIKAQRDRFDYEKASAKTTAEIFGDAEIPVTEGERESVPALGLLSAKQRAETQARARMAQASSKGMSVGEFRKINDIDIPGKDTDWLSPAAIDAYKFRLRSEASPASVKSNYAQLSNGINLLSKLRDMREEAVNESPVGGGPASGRAISLLSKGEKGALYPKTAAYLALKQANLAGIAELMGEKGRKAEGDIERADKAVPGLEYDPKAAKLIFDSVLSVGKFNKDNLEYQFSDLKRLKERAEEAKLTTVSGKGEPTLREQIASEKARRKALQETQKANP